MPPAEDPAAPPGPALAALLSRLAAEPWSFHFYHALRALEAAHPHLPRFGTSRRLRDDPVRLGQEPTLAFAPSTLASFRRDGAVPRLDAYLFGVFGPNGPLPLHLTEYARERERNYRDGALRRFADLFHHRLIQLFYRAWANAQPVTHADRPDDDRFALYVGALEGMALEGLRDRDRLPDTARLHWVGLFAMPTGSAEGLERMLGGFFGLPVTIEPCVGHWIHVPPEGISQLGFRACRLGDTAMLGERVWDCAGKFRVVVGPVGYAAFERFLPGRESLARVDSVVRFWTGGALWWDLQVVLKRDEVPGTRLNGRSGLGWNTWLLGAPATRDAREYIWDPALAAV
jgi:type VI secretion system protein ImpH